MDAAGACSASLPPWDFWCKKGWERSSSCPAAKQGEDGDHPRCPGWQKWWQRPGRDFWPPVFSHSQPPVINHPCPHPRGTVQDRPQHPLPLHTGPSCGQHCRHVPSLSPGRGRSPCWHFPGWTKAPCSRSGRGAEAQAGLPATLLASDNLSPSMGLCAHGAH